MKRVVFLCSGNGGNLKFLKSVIDLDLLPSFSICGVVSDRECAAIEFAKTNGIKSWVADFSEQGQELLVDEIDILAPDVLITNIHKILFSTFVNRFQGKMINLHYSMLPAFPGVIGTKPVEQAIAYGAKWIGTTVHFVDETLDMGRPISQSMLPLFDGDTVPSIMDVIFRAGCISLHSSLSGLSSATHASRGETTLVCLGGRQVNFNPPIKPSSFFDDEAFWSSLKA